MEIVTRNEALASGLKRFCTGEPCVHGHFCERITSNKACVVCHRLQSAKHRSANPERALERDRLYKANNKDKIKERSDTRRRKNPEKHRANCRQWRENNRDKYLEICKKFRNKNREKINKYAAEKRRVSPITQRLATRLWRERNPEKAKESTRKASAKAFVTKRDYVIAYIRKRKKRVAQATPVWADMAMIAEKYKEARMRSVETGILHVVDHIYPLRGRLVSGLNIAINMQVITAAENRKKSNNMPNVVRR